MTPERPPGTGDHQNGRANDEGGEGTPCLRKARQRVHGGLIAGESDESGGDGGRGDDAQSRRQLREARAKEIGERKRPGFSQDRSRQKGERGDADEKAKEGAGGRRIIGQARNERQRKADDDRRIGEARIAAGHRASRRVIEGDPHRMQKKTDRRQRDDREIGRDDADQPLRRADAVKQGDEAVSEEKGGHDNRDAAVEACPVDQRLLLARFAH